MEIVQAAEGHIARFANEFADLMHATSPVIYDYQFDRACAFATWCTDGNADGD